MLMELKETPGKTGETQEGKEEIKVRRTTGKTGVNRKKEF